MLRADGHSQQAGRAYGRRRKRRALSGLRAPAEYEVVVKPLRYRTQPHLAARCEFEERRIVLQVPVPFRPFKEPVVFAARRKRGHRDPLRMGVRDSVFPAPPGGAAVPLLPRVDALVPVRSAGQAIRGGDRVRPLRAEKLPTTSGFDRGRGPGAAGGAELPGSAALSSPYTSSMANSRTAALRTTSFIGLAFAALALVAALISVYVMASRPWGCSYRATLQP